jgi:hypothetical protein
MANTNTKAEPAIITRAKKLEFILNKYIGTENRYSKRIREIINEYENIAMAIVTNSKGLCKIEITKVNLYLFGTKETTEIELNVETLKEILRLYEAKLQLACADAEKIYNKLSL